MHFGSGLVFVYDETWEFIRRAWWVALIPSAPLAVGFLILSDAPSPPVWQQAAFWCVLVLTAVLRAALPYCVMRFVALGHDLAAALSVNRASARTFAPYLAAMSALHVAALIGARYDPSGSFAAGIGIVSLFLFPLLSPWSVTAPSGSTVIGPERSIRLVLPHLLWALALFIGVLLPVGLLQTVSNAALVRLLDLLDGQSSFVIVTTLAGMLFKVATDLLTIVAQFAIAQKAGMRVGADRSLAAMFD